MMLLIFPMFSLKQCDMKYQWWFNLFPQVRLGRKKNQNREEEMYPRTGFGHKKDKVSWGEQIQCN